MDKAPAPGQSVTYRGAIEPINGLTGTVVRPDPDLFPATPGDGMAYVAFAVSSGAWKCPVEDLTPA